jgi:hypothetical protein
LKMKKDVLSLGLGAPSLDLSNDELSDPIPRIARRADPILGK